MSVSVHLTFPGTCEAAFQHYARCFDGVLDTSVALTRYGDTPMPVDADWRDKIVHGTFVLGGSRLAGADFKDAPAPTGFFVLVDIGDAPVAERVFAALADGGKVAMPMQKTFWAHRFGALVDRFGIPWEINCSG